MTKTTRAIFTKFSTSIIAHGPRKKPRQVFQHEPLEVTCKENGIRVQLLM